RAPLCIARAVREAGGSISLFDRAVLRNRALLRRRIALFCAQATAQPGRPIRLVARTALGARPPTRRGAECPVPGSPDGSCYGGVGEGFRMPSGVRKPPKHEPAGVRRRSMGISVFSRAW